MKNNYIKIKLLASIFTITTASFSYAQVRIVETTTLIAAEKSSAFIDASSIPVLNSTSNIGKGLLFPRTDLSTFTSFGGSPIGIGNSYPTRYDGMIVYNTKDGGKAGVGNTEGDLKPGFWFYENKSTSTNNGTWKQISSPTTNILSLSGNTLTSTVNGVLAQVTLPAASSGIDNPANNGLSKDGTTIQLGGVLNKKTNIDNYGHDFNINGTGKVGIGTWDPTQKLDVRGTVRIVDGTQGAGKVLTSDANGIASWESLPSVNTVNTLAISGNTLTSNVNGISASVNIPVGNGVDNPANNGLSKDGTTIQLGGNLNKDTRIDNFGNSFRIVGAGNTGIGTDNPTNKLHVNGKLRLEDGTQGIGKVLTSDATGVASWSNLPESGVDNPANNGLSKNGTTIQLGGNLNKDTRIDNFGNSFRIVGAGNTGIGTDNPTNKLHIANGKLRIEDGTQGNNKVLTSNAQGVASWTNADDLISDFPRLVNMNNIFADEPNREAVLFFASAGITRGKTLEVPIPANTRYRILLNFETQVMSESLTGDGAGTFQLLRGNTQLFGNELLSYGTYKFVVDNAVSNRNGHNQKGRAFSYVVEIDNTGQAARTETIIFRYTSTRVIGNPTKFSIRGTFQTFRMP